MKKYVVIIVAIIIVSLIATGGILIHNVKKYKKLYQRERENIEAYQEENAGLNGEIRQYKMTIDELYASNDIKDKKIVETMESLKIKDKHITDLQYQLSNSSKTDTLTFKDTIFIDKDFCMDTTLGDDWYTMQLHLEYPSTIVTSPSFESEQYVIIHNKKEYNKKPSKCFFVRWFQKKHWVTEVTVEEKSPYVNVKERKYIKIEK